MVVQFGPFQGVSPRIDPYLLQVTQAEDCLNCYFASGSLKALKAAQLASLSMVGGEGDIETLYRHYTLNKSYWLSFRGAAADLAPSPVSRDTYRRLYFTSPAYNTPRMVSESLLTENATNPGASYALGIPAPVTDDIQVSSAVGGDTSGGIATAESRYYAVTWVSQFGEESAPSGLVGLRDPETQAVTGPVVVYPGGVVTITVPVLFASSATEYVISKANIYRTNKGSSATKLQFVGELVLYDGTWHSQFTDTKLSAELAEVIQTTTWTEPQAELTGITALANGALSGYVGRQLCFSEPYFPHAWPVEYEQPLEDDIVGQGVFGRSLLVLTTRNPVLFTGDHPNAMERQRIDDGLACVSKRSIVDIGVGICYATPEGIMYVGTSGARLITGNLFTRREWLALEPSSIHAYNFGGRYVGFYDNGTDRRGFILDLDGNWSWLSDYATAGFYDSRSGSLYLVKNNAQGDAQAFKFDEGNSQNCYWLSRPLSSNRDMHFSAARVIADTYPCILTIYSDEVDSAGQPVDSHAVLNDKPFRLTSGYRSNKYRVSITASGTVSKVYLAESIRELVQA